MEGQKANLKKSSMDVCDGYCGITVYRGSRFDRPSLCSACTYIFTFKSEPDKGWESHKSRPFQRRPVHTHPSLDIVHEAE